MSTKKYFHDVTRREFVQFGTSIAAIAAGGRSWSTTPSSPQRGFEHGDPLEQFGYGDVQFQKGLHQAQLEHTHEILMSLDEDSLLRPYRLAAELPAPGNDLGGWYSAPRFVGETFGQWISALSRYYAITGDEPTRLKVERLVDGFVKTTEPTGKIFQVNGNPMYFHDKLVSGIEDAAALARSASALKALSTILDNSQVVLEKKAAWLTSGIERAKGENYNFAETYFLAWERSGDARYFDLARRDLQDGFCDPLSRGQNVLALRHAYSHINGLCGAAKAYLVLGDETYLKAAMNGLAFAEQQSFVTGTYGPSEQFLPRPAIDYPDPDTGETKHYPAIESLGDSILNEKNHFETGCGSYAHFKLTRYLLRTTRNPKYGDSMERVMYNAALGVKPINKFGKAFYQSNYHSHAHKAYFDGYSNIMPDQWPCCSGTLSQLVADYRVSTYFRDQLGLFVNLFIPSTVRWEQQGAKVSLAQSGAYPLDDHITFAVTLSKPTRFAVRLRIPAWTDASSIRVNGKPVSQPVQSSTFATIHREWTSGDRIELELPRKLELKAVDAAHPNLVALVCGPLVLFAISDDTPKVTREQLLAARQRSAGSEEWSTRMENGSLRLLPWWAIKDETYFTYLTV